MSRGRSVVIHAPPCINQTASGRLLDSAGSSALGSVITQGSRMGGWERGSGGRQYMHESELRVKVVQSCLALCDPHGLYSPWNSPGQNTGAGSLSLLQGIFPTQGSNPDHPHCRQIPYQLSYEGSPNMCVHIADSCFCAAETNATL